MNYKPNMEMMKSRKKELGWSNLRLAKESGIPVGTLNKLFNGTTKYPRDKTVYAVVRALGIEYAGEAGTGIRASMMRETGIYRSTKKEQGMTIAGYYALPDELKGELIDGKIYYREEPSLEHQKLLTMLSGTMFRYFYESKRSEQLLISPCGVKLEGDDYTLLKPDIFVAAAREMLAGGEYCDGTPEFVVEIASQNSDMDYELKRYKYQSAGVKEYWVVDPGKNRVVVYVFAEDSLPKVYGWKSQVRSWIYPELEIDFAGIAKELL